MRAVIKLKNNKKIKISIIDLSITEDENDYFYNIKIKLNPIYFGYFNTDDHTIEEIYIKRFFGLFTQSESLYPRQDEIPSYEIINGKLILTVSCNYI